MRHHALCAVTVVASLAAVACAASSDSNDTHAPDSAAASTTTAAVPFGPAAYGPIRMCAPLDSVAALAARIGATSVRDTVIESEEERWPAKAVTLGDGGSALFESSWADTTHVWRFSTTSPRALTAHGAHVGATVGDLPAASGPFAVEVSEGAARINFSGDDVGARVDNASERGLEASNAGKEGPLGGLPASARVMELIAARHCGNR